MAPTALDYLPSPRSFQGVAIILAATLLILYLIQKVFISVPYPHGMPIVGQPAGSRRISLRTRLRYYTDCEGLFIDAYQNYAKKGLPVVIPGFGFRKEVILPQSQMKWVLAQPEQVLSLDDALVEIDQAKYSAGDERVVKDGWQGLLVKTDLNKVLEHICEAMKEELYLAFDEHFGSDAENWKEIELIPAMQMITAQAANRFVVGYPLCRDKEYMKNSIDLHECFILNAGVTSGTPGILQPVVGYLANFRTRRLLHKMKKWILPLWKQRLTNFCDSKDDHGKEEPQDLLQMMLRFAERNRPHELRNDDIMVARVATANFGAMHQSQMQITNLILDVLGSDAEFNTISVLRDEFEGVLGEEKNPLWTKSMVNRMIRADSVIRETLRLHGFGGRAVFRKVMTSDFKTPDGYHIPKGTVISFLSKPAHTDPETTEDPFKFDPFRFSRQREEAGRTDAAAPHVSMVTTSPEYLVFGHGKHACPGRFLIDFELKMILAYMLRNYDIAFPDMYGGKRPPNVWMAEAIFPPDGVRIKVKRKRGM